nr:flavin-containing monooxygenase FMO GS-OX5-like isoform X2 [Procambarus clarkii]
MKVVGVIGGGAAGLCAARHILATGDMLPVVWEKATKVGGTWVYSPQSGTDEHGLPIHSSMYKNLKTNLPKEVMAFPDYPFQSSDSSFIHHTEVLKYLESYAEHHKLYPYIKFGHYVEEVKPVMKGEGPPAWDVRVRCLESEEITTTTVDAIFVCNGHYSVPRLPQIEDIEKFKGRQSHSHDYREPSSYKGATVVILGAAASGLDIAIELSTVAKEVILSHNLPTPVPSELPPNVRQVRGVVSALENGFVFGDGSSAEADVIVYCTGYTFSFPFLSKECGITVEDNIVKPLYKHLINTKYTSMAFIGIPFLVCPFPLFDFQVQYFMAVMKGVITLLSREEMDDATLSELHRRRRLGYTDRHFHRLGLERQQNFTDEVSALIGIPPEKPSKKKMVYITLIRLYFSINTFKKYQYKIDSNDRVTEMLDMQVVHTWWDLGWLVARQTARLLWHDFFGVLNFVVAMFFSKLKSYFV